MDPVTEQRPAAGRLMGMMNISGLQFEVLDFPPELFPEGAVLLSQRPGKLEIVDRIPLPTGALVASLHPEQAGRLRGEITRQARARQNQHAKPR